MKKLAHSLLFLLLITLPNTLPLKAKKIEKKPPFTIHIKEVDGDDEKDKKYESIAEKIVSFTAGFSMGILFMKFAPIARDYYRYGNGRIKYAGPEREIYIADPNDPSKSIPYEDSDDDSDFD